MDNKLKQYLTEEEVLEFQALVKEIDGIELTFEEASDQGTKLIQSFELLQSFEPVSLSVKDIVDNQPESVKKDS